MLFEVSASKYREDNSKVCKLFLFYHLFQIFIFLISFLSNCSFISFLDGRLGKYVLVITGISVFLVK